MKNFLFPIILTAMVAASCCGNRCGGFDVSRMALADSVINASIAASNYPGAVLAVVKDNKIVYEKAYGYKQVFPDTVAMTKETVFDLASISKCVGTTLSFMQLVQDGRVRLTDNVKRYIPGFKPWVSEDGQQVDITVEHLLTHSSGLDAYYNGNTFRKRFGDNQPDSLKKVIATEVKRNFEPGKGFIYSCLNFISLQYILEEVTGERLCDYAQRNVFDRLGLEHTCYLPSGDMVRMCAPTEVDESTGLPFQGVVHDPLARIANGGNSGNAGVFSTAEDLCKIAIAILNEGALPGKPKTRILAPQTVRIMETEPASVMNHRCLGWDLSSPYAGVKGDLLSKDRTLNHSGYTGTSLAIDLDNRVAVIFLTNRAHPHDGGSTLRDRAVIANIVASALKD